uniref:NADH-ubiquinone oxidoreductase chain 6 n=1 Tax=Staphylinidae sp. BMNH 1274240 TaxID=1796567 RepID=A0A126TEP6_9COLE|nr:NADH dehydrogenase subunit 6 [Staphylinidae sp. BMNH 1274240]
MLCISMMMSILFIMSMMFIFMNHPLSMGLILLMQTTLIALITGNLCMNFWFSYILFLIMIGGMLILFIYMTSIASNEKFKFSYSHIMFFIPAMLIMMYMISINKEYLFTFNNNLNISNNFDLNLNKYINFPSNIIMIMMIIYLLITLIAIVKITNFKSGPLRQKI